MGDYFDLWLLSQHPQLNKTTLRTAIERTFRNRKMEKEATCIGLSAEFGDNPDTQALQALRDHPGTGESDRQG